MSKPPPLKQPVPLIYRLLPILLVVMIWLISTQGYRLHPLYRAIMRGDVAVVRDRVSAHNDQVEHRFTGLNATPLHLASKRGDVEMIELLISQGAAIDVRGYRNLCMPLHVAASYGQTNAMKVLIKLGASIDARDRHGLTPLHCAASNDRGDAIRILVAHGADITAKVNGQTPMDMAYYCGHAIAALVESGAYGELDGVIQRYKIEIGATPRWQIDERKRLMQTLSVLEEFKKRQKTGGAGRLEEGAGHGGAQ